MLLSLISLVNYFHERHNHQNLALHISFKITVEKFHFVMLLIDGSLIAFMTLANVLNNSAFFLLIIDMFCSLKQDQD